MKQKPKISDYLRAIILLAFLIFLAISFIYITYRFYKMMFVEGFIAAIKGLIDIIWMLLIDIAGLLCIRAYWLKTKDET